ncbi:hypothetical protein EON65_21685 [archaeon]|nr:MAG: hypothetical protein EON65_21685 [archaeon]
MSHSGFEKTEEAEAETQSIREEREEVPGETCGKALGRLSTARKMEDQAHVALEHGNGEVRSADRFDSRLHAGVPSLVTLPSSLT